MDIERSYFILTSMNFNVPIFIAMIVLVACSAFFSMSETAFSSSSIVKLRLAVEDRRAGSKKAIELTEKFDRTLTTLLVGNNIVNTALSTIAFGFFGNIILDQRWVELVSTAVITIVLLIFGEIMPKTIAKLHAEEVTLKVSWPVYIIMIILYPIVVLFQLLQKLFTRGKVDDAMNEDELEIALHSMEDNGKIEEQEVDLIKKVLDLNDRNTEDIMVPRIDVVGIDYSSSLQQVKKTLQNNNFSRIPVYKEDKDHIVGILFERDFFKAYADKKDLDWKKLIKPAKYVSAAMKVDALIKYLQQEKTHLAIVSGEYGDTLGLVTMEDALEELVGEIYDEHDEAGTNDVSFVKNEDGTYTVDADIYVEDLFELLDVGSAPEDAPSKLYSWMFEYCEEIPKVGISMEYFSNYTKLEDEEYVDYVKKLTFTIDSVDDRRIETIKISVEDASKEEIEALEEATEE